MLSFCSSYINRTLGFILFQQLYSLMLHVASQEMSVILLTSEAENHGAVNKSQPAQQTGFVAKMKQLPAHDKQQNAGSQFVLRKLHAKKMSAVPSEAVRNDSLLTMAYEELLNQVCVPQLCVV